MAYRVPIYFILLFCVELPITEALCNYIGFLTRRIYCPVILCYNSFVSIMGAHAASCL